MDRETKLLAVLRRNMNRAIRLRRLEEAEAILEQLRAEDPVSRHTRGFELELLLAREQHSQAASLARQLVDLYPDSPRIHFLAAIVLYRKHDYLGATEHFRESIRLHPPDSLARQWLGRSLTQMGSFEEAERILLSVLAERFSAHKDLAWLYERRGDVASAIDMIERLLREKPSDTYAQQSLKRLRARQLQPGELQQEVEALADLGDAPDPNILPEYIDDLLQTGQGVKARSVLASRMPTIDARVATRTGWVAYKRRAYDMALQLFLRAFSENVENFKFLAALERAAGTCGRLGDVLALYRAHAGAHRSLHGRIRRLQQVIADEASNPARRP